MEYTGFSEPEYTAFYDPTNVGSFGNSLSIELVGISEFYDCPDASDTNPSFPTNCSSEYLAYGQWGGSMISNNPPVNDSDIFPQSLTLKDWGIPGID